MITRRAITVPRWRRAGKVITKATWYNGLVVDYKRNHNSECLVCRTPIYRRPTEIKRNNGRVFCSQACYGISCRKEVPCVVCGKMILASANKKTCSRACANKNRTGIKYRRDTQSRRDKVKTNRFLKIRLREERGGCCERCGLFRYEILHVHHRDRNRNNNDLINLELICPNCHAEEHLLKHRSPSKI